MEDEDKKGLSGSPNKSETHTPKAEETPDECSENSDIQLQNANKFSYLLGLFEIPCPSVEGFGKPLDLIDVTIETATPMIADEEEVTKDIEDELFIKSTEPASNSLILNMEQNTSEISVPLKSSRNLSSASPKTQPIPRISPLAIKAHTPLERVTSSQISRANCNKAHTTHKVKHGSMIYIKNTETPKIDKQNNYEKEPHSSDLLIINKKSSENYEANITISFKFVQNQVSQLQHVQKDIITDFCSMSVDNNDTDAQSEVIDEIAINSVDLNVATCRDKNSPVSLISKLSFTRDSQRSNSNEPLLILNGPMTSRSSQYGTRQPLKIFHKDPSLVSPVSLITTEPNQPQSLFLQALTKLTESSLSLTIPNSRQENATSPITSVSTTNRSVQPYYAECSPPDSLTCAPPSYSFVIRQTARRRPRLMGTFLSSPSFVRKTPPPTYAAAFDIYVDSPLPPQATRMFTYGFTETLVVCPECGYAGLTFVRSKVTFCTHICAFLLCLLCCWICAPLPYILRSCKDVYHYCRNCRNLLGIYRAYTPESGFTVS